MRRAALAAGLLLAALAAPATAQPAPPGVRVQVFVDQRRNPGAGERHLGYRLGAAGGALQLRPASDELLRRWNGDAVLGQGTRLDFGEDAATWPVFLVLDLANESGRTLQVTQAFLQVDASSIEAQPYLQLSPWDREALVLRNLGWGPAENAVLRFELGPQRAAGEGFTLELGTLGSVRVNPERAMVALVPALAQLRLQPPPCPSYAQVPDCLAQLQRTVAVGSLSDIAIVRRDRVMTRLSGTLSYQWRDAAGGLQERTQPIDTELQLFSFKVPVFSSPALAAPGPEQGGFAPLAFQLERSGYRISLPYRPRLGPGETQRFQLALTAPKASRHRLRVVVEYEGRRSRSEPIDLLYFVPQPDAGEPRLVH